MSEPTMHIGEVAERVGLSLRTIRYYEEIGLIAPSARSQGGFRLYLEADVARLQLVKDMKPLGFSLDEMRDLLGVLDKLDDETSAEGTSRSWSAWPCTGWPPTPGATPCAVSCASPSRSRARCATGSPRTANAAANPSSCPSCPCP